MKAKRNRFGIGPEISLFTLGTMRAIESIEQMYLVAKEACLAGINHIETAPAYGPAEFFLGESLKKLKADGIKPEGNWIITSKILPEIGISDGKTQIKGILKRLGIQKIHNLAIHGLNLPKHLDWALKGEGAKLLKWAKNEELVGQVGFTSHGSLNLIEEAINSRQFQFCSLHLHLLDQSRMPLALKALTEGMGVMAISPADKGGHLHLPSTTLIEDCYPILPLELAYRFLLGQGISTLTLGAHKIEDFSLAKKLINSNDPLKGIEKRAIENMFNRMKSRLGETFCGQCKKCLPCPEEIPIPEILRLRNLAIGLDLKTFAKERYNLIGQAGHWWEKKNGSACIKCGDCLPRCPYSLDIPSLLSNTNEELQGNPVRRLWR